MVGFSGEERFCSVTYGDGRAYTTTGRSLIEAAANAIKWAEVELRRFGTARLLPDKEVLTISVGVGGGETYRVRVGRVKAWMRPPLPLAYATTLWPGIALGVNGRRAGIAAWIRWMNRGFERGFAALAVMPVGMDQFRALFNRDIVTN